MAEVGTLDYARLLVCVFRAIGALLGGNLGEDTNPGPENQRVEEEDSLRPVHHHRLPHRFVHSDPWRGLQRGEQVHGHHRQRLPGELHRTGEPLLGWRHAPAVYLRAGRHAVHHRVHRGAAAARGHPPLRGPAQGGPVRRGQAHPVHPLPDHRPGRAPVHHHPGHRPLRRPVQLPVRPGHPGRLRVQPRGHGPHHDRRHRPDHVDGRARDRQGHRPGHVHLDLHVHLLRLPAAAVGDRLRHQRHRRRLAQVRHRRGRARGHPHLRRLRRTVPAPRPGPVHAPHDRP